MLENSDNEKPIEIHIENEKWQKIRKLTMKQIIEKLSDAKELLKLGKFDNISAGLYTYALEEFGKLLLLDNCENIANNTKKKIKYRREFTCHKKKFETAFDYLENYSPTSDKCIFLNNEGGFSRDSFSWKGFSIGLLADFEARMSIFYTDFSYKLNEKGESTDEININEIPRIEKEFLKEAIDELSNIINQTSSTQTE